jgi:signal transduction histidine kinase
MELLACHTLLREMTILQAETEFSQLRLTAHAPQCEHPGQASSPLAVPDRLYDIVIRCSACALGLSSRDMVIVDVEHCFAVVAGRELARHLLGQGHHLLTPGWLANWRMRIAAWGFDDQGIRQFFGESQSRFLLLNTGTDDHSLDHLESFANHVGRPFEVLHVGLEPMRRFLRRQVLHRSMQLEVNALQAELHRKNEDLANHASALEMLAELTLADSLPAGVQRLHTVFQMLFAPQHLAIYYSRHGKNSPFDLVGALPPDLSPAAVIGGNDPYWLLPDHHGFVFRIGSRERPFAFVCAGGLAFPENAPRYLNMGLEMRTACVVALTSLSERDQRRTVERQLVEARRVHGLGYVAGSLAHHINNIMANIIASTEVAQILSDDSAELAGPLGDILAHSARASALASSFLAAAGGSTEPPIATDLASLVHGVVQAFQAETTIPLTINVAIHDQPLQLEVSPSLLTRSLRALLDNAAEAVAGMASPNVTVAIGGLEQVPSEHTLFGVSSQSLTDGATVVAVADNGRGMSQETLTRAIEPFFTTQRLGRGMGLAMAYGAMLSHRGGIAVASRVGKGSTVALIFPHHTTDPSLVAPLALSNQ